MTKDLNWDDFQKVEMRIGTILEAQVFRGVKNPAYKLLIDFGEFGQLKSSAQLTNLYQAEELIGKQIIAVVNFPPKQIANMMSECLVIGAVGDNKDVILINPDRKVKNGLRLA